MSVTFQSGNLFDSDCQTIVNTVNCVGVMGKGVALLTRLRYPALFAEYQKKCAAQEIKVGSLWLYKALPPAPWVLNFPTKIHWKDPSRFEYLEKGLAFFLQHYQEWGITSIAFPLLGAHNGGLPPERVKELMSRYLSEANMRVDVYTFNARAPDALFNTFKKRWSVLSPAALRADTGIRQEKQIALITEALLSKRVGSMLELVELKGIGLKTMESCFRFTMAPQQQSLF
jgi:O-acetyl-ADP-ribose deacetylase (regulator of RNase III)